MRTRNLPVLPALALSLFAASPALANGFKSDLDGPIAGFIAIEVVLSDDLIQRADALPTDISKRSGARSSRAGFAGNGHYGMDALQDLVEETREELSEDFAKAGLEQSDAAATIMRVTIDDVKNNRPTFRQLTVQPALDFDSFGYGGAELSVNFTDRAGTDLGTMSYEYYDRLDNDFRFARANGVWTDARRAISRFSKKATKAIVKSQRPDVSG